MVKFTNNVKNESLVDDPHELLLSLVDLGALDVEDALLACVKEMSDAECKRILNSLSLPECCDEVDKPEEPAEELKVSDEAEPEPDDKEDNDGAEDVTPELENQEDDSDDEDDTFAELESRVANLEKRKYSQCEARINRLEAHLRRKIRENKLNRRTQECDTNFRKRLKKEAYEDEQAKTNHAKALAKKLANSKKLQGWFDDSKPFKIVDAPDGGMTIKFLKSTGSFNPIGKITPKIDDTIYYIVSDFDDERQCWSEVSELNDNVLSVTINHWPEKGLPDDFGGRSYHKNPDDEWEDPNFQDSGRDVDFLQHQRDTNDWQ